MILCFLAFFRPVIAQSVDYKNPQTYFLMVERELIGAQARMILVYEAFATSDTNQMMYANEQLKEQTFKSLVNLRSMPLFQGEAQLKYTALEIIELYDSLARKDFEEIITIFKKQNFTPEEMTHYYFIFEYVKIQEAMREDGFRVAQISFKERHLPDASTALVFDGMSTFGDEVDDEPEELEDLSILGDF